MVTTNEANFTGQRRDKSECQWAFLVGKGEREMAMQMDWGRGAKSVMTWLVKQNHIYNKILTDITQYERLDNHFP